MTIEEEIERIHQRMDSFVDQVTETKKLQESQEMNVIRKVENAIKVSHNFLAEYKEVQETTDRIKNSLTERFSDEVKKIQKENALFKVDLTNRFNDLEKYIKNERFHSILLELNKLEDEYHDKAIKIVKKMAAKKKCK